jgi:hypothetical protein
MVQPKRQMACVCGARAVIAGQAVDVVADDMTREGVELDGELDPEEIAEIEERASPSST